MKKIIVSLSLCLGVVFSSVAQSYVYSEEEVTVKNPAYVSKRGVSLLPEAGDFAIGIDATPFLEFLGNMFNNSSNNSVLFNGVDNTIYGKYFLEDNRAIRAKIRLNIYGDQFKKDVTNDTEVGQNPQDIFATVIDVQSIATQDIDFFAGYEFRRGRGRVQGFWGGEIGIGFAGGKATYDYANEITAMNVNPSTANFSVNGFGSNVNYSSPSLIRTTEYKIGPSFRGTVAGFAGVEYFFAPQISIGGELNLALVYQTKGQNQFEGEQWNESTNSIQTISWRDRNTTDVANRFGLKTRTTGQIFLMFHF